MSKPRSLLRSLLCCLGRRRGSRSPSPTPAPEENGHLSVPAGQPAPVVLLPPVTHHDMGRVCLVVDLDETLVHSSFKVRWWPATSGCGNGAPREMAGQGAVAAARCGNRAPRDITCPSFWVLLLPVGISIGKRGGSK